MFPGFIRKKTLTLLCSAEWLTLHTARRKRERQISGSTRKPSNQLWKFKGSGIILFEGYGGIWKRLQDFTPASQLPRTLTEERSQEGPFSHAIRMDYRQDFTGMGDTILSPVETSKQLSTMLLLCTLLSSMEGRLGELGENGGRSFLFLFPRRNMHLQCPAEGWLHRLQQY